MEDNKIRVGITQGDINGVGYEVILKTFSDPMMLELCTPIIYGSPKVAAYHRKSLDLPTNFSIVNSASEAVPNRLSVVNCTDDEVKVEFSKPDPEAGKAALGALEKAIEEYKAGLIDVIVTAPINKHTIQSEEFSFPGHTEYIEEKLGDGGKALMILMKDDLRVALVTGHIPVREIASAITKELIQEKLLVFNRALKQDFGIGAPRIAVLSLNPHAGDEGLLGTEEQEVIIPAIKELAGKGILCYGPYPADGFMGSGNFTHFDGILAMYHDQGLAPFKSLAITKELIQEKLLVFNRALKQDFGIGAPRIAVLSLNPHAGDEGLLGTEEQEVIIPAIKELAGKGILCYGPYPADGFMGSGNFTHFDGILAMYHDQGLAPFKSLAMDEGVNYTAGLPVVRTSPAHGTAYDIAGKGIASEDSFRQAVYVAIDVFRNRMREQEAHANPLRKQYYERRDDSDKLKLDSTEEDL